jgi:hypothetical protein
MRLSGRIRASAPLCGVTAAMLIFVGCGGGSDFQNKPRPAVPVELTGVITNSKVTVSPNKVGAGPVVITVSNQTQHSHTLTLDGSSIAPVRVGPINPLDTAQIQKTLRPGQYEVKAGSEQAATGNIAPARLVIGKARPDSNNQVGLP